MVFLVWLRNEALNALKMWSLEHFSGGKMMKKMNSIKQHIVYLSFIGSKQCYFGQNTSFHLNEMESL
jgi:S-ribosylhomocysteine lyase LuxS involved in autoinducer biosynthesis